MNERINDGRCGDIEVGADQDCILYLQVGFFTCQTFHLGIHWHDVLSLATYKHYLIRMWANAQRDGHPAEYRWRPLFNAAKFG